MILAALRSLARPLRPFLVWSAAALALVAGSRALFLIVYCGSEAPAGAFVFSSEWLRGMRFDLASIPPLMILPLVQSALLLWRRWPVLQTILAGAQALLFFLATLLLFASAYNYGYNQKHLGWEFFGYLNEAPLLVRASLSRQTWLGALLSPIALAAFLVLRAASSPPNRIAVHPGRGPRLTPALIFLALLSLPILGRGGFQQSPLRAADAIGASGKACLDQAVLNGLFTVFRDADDRDEFTPLYPEAENRAAVRALIDNGHPWLSEEYPLLRWMPSTSGRQPDLILILMESLSASLLAEHGGDPALAPEMQALIDRGRYFRRAISSGGRSANGQVAIFTGLPDRAGRTILRSNQIHNRFGGLPRLLRDRGYRTLFVTGADLKFDNRDGAFPWLGFETSLGRRELAARRVAARQMTLGYHDGDVFRIAKQEAEAQPTPLFLAMLTLNTHHPFPLPEGFPRYTAEQGRLPDFLNAIHYADHSLGAFVRSLRASPRFRDAVIVITADHSHHQGLDYLQDRHIPLLILGPGIAPGKDERLVSQLDIGPTLLALAGGDGPYAMMGDNLLGPLPPERGVFFAGGSNTNAIGWVQGDWISFGWLNSPHTLFLRGRHPAEQRDRSAEFPELAALFVERARRFHQFARGLEMQNRIWPPEGELLQIADRFRQKPAQKKR